MIDRIIAIPALKDNYIWALVNQEAEAAIIIDPGESDPALNFLQTHGLTLQAILITHHHWDHTNGIAGITNVHQVKVYGPAHEPVTGMSDPVDDKAQIQITHFPIFNVLAIPGHTRGHIAYHVANHLFCGDTLFAAGCGRLFEGTAEQMFNSLQRLSQLANETKIYCAHEYTLNNLKFAAEVEPSNEAITKRTNKIKDLRNHGQPSLPSSIQEERATNPFLRCQEATIIKAASFYAGTQLTDSIAVFAALRKWKDHF